MREVVGYAVKVRLENESVWGGFVRGVLSLEGAGGGLGGELGELMEKERGGGENGEDDVFWRRVKETVEWVEKARG